MTPVDHAEAKRIAEILLRDIDNHRAWVPGPDEDKPSGLFFVHEDVEPVLRAYLDCYVVGLPAQPEDVSA